MEKSPLHWALGVAAMVGFGALYFGERLADGMALEEEAPALAAREKASAPATRPDPVVTVSADYRGHFMVFPTVDNYRVRMMVDTGASAVALTAQDARAIGVHVGPGDYRVRMSTANGVVRAARVNLREIRLGGILLRNVEAVVMPAGVLGISLLGNSFLGKLRGYEVQSGRMVLRG